MSMLVLNNPWLCSLALSSSSCFAFKQFPKFCQNMVEKVGDCMLMAFTEFAVCVQRWGKSRILPLSSPLLDAKRQEQEVVLYAKDGRWPWEVQQPVLQPSLYGTWMETYLQKKTN